MAKGIPCTYLKDSDGKGVSQVLVPTQDHTTIQTVQVGATDLVCLGVDPVQTVIHIVCETTKIPCVKTFVADTLDLMHVRICMCL